MSRIILGNTVNGKLSLKKNSSNVVSNTQITSLQVVNTNAFQFKVITTGPIRVYWGDNTYTDISTQSSLYTVNKTYSTTGTYNIIITNQEKVIRLQFDHTTYAPKINTNVSWFSQFYNLQFIYLNNASFIGDLALIIENINTMNGLYLNYTTSTSLYLIVSNCITLWTKLIFLYIYDLNSCNILKGDSKYINVNTECLTISVRSNSIYFTCSNINGILKNGYTALTILSFTFKSNISIDNSPVSFDTIVFPPTCTLLGPLEYFGSTSTFGKLDNFNFTYLTYIQLILPISCNLSNNNSFTTYASNSSGIYIYTNNDPFIIKVDLSLFNRSSGTPYVNILLQTRNGYNECYGDASIVINNTSSYLSIIGGKNDNSLIGTFDGIISPTTVFQLSYVDLTCSNNILKIILERVTNRIVLISLPNFTGSIDTTNFIIIGSIEIRYMLNLSADITTFTYSTNFYNNVYTYIIYTNNPNFTGNLGSLILWSNKSQILLNNCSYTGIPNFVRNVFTQRNTCLKATGGTTTINVANNVDNASVTGVLQRGSLGTYVGNQNDLTETQIDNLANGLDYTGTGSNVAWTDKEKIWWLLNCKNSSTDPSSRYRLSSFSI